MPFACADGDAFSGRSITSSRDRRHASSTAEPPVGIALLYIRQSKRDKASTSPENQEAACRDLADVKVCEKVTVYRDLGISGGKPPEKRPGFLALRQRIESADKSREPLVIAAYDQSRWSRDDVDSMQFYAFLEARPWINVQMIDGSFDRSPDGQWSWGMRALNAQHQRKLTAKKIKAAYATKNAKGQPTGPAPFGYKYAGGKSTGSRDGGTLEIETETAPIVRRIFDLYASGDHSTRTIADTLNTEAVPATGAHLGKWMGDSVGYPSRIARVARLHRSAVGHS